MRAIVRLEQGANSYMQRAIASHGAFAILYGRYSKHYIKKPEVFETLQILDLPFVGYNPLFSFSSFLQGFFQYNMLL